MQVTNVYNHTCAMERYNKITSWIFSTVLDQLLLAQPILIAHILGLNIAADILLEQLLSQDKPYKGCSAFQVYRAEHSSSYQEVVKQQSCART